MTIFQVPNKLLATALVAAVAGRLVGGWPHAVLGAVFYISISIWCYDEIRHGVNWVRRGLGVAVLAYVLVSLANNLHRL